MKNLLIRLVSSLLIITFLGLGFKVGYSGILYLYRIVAPKVSAMIYDMPAVALAGYIVLTMLLATFGGFIIYRIGLLVTKSTNLKQIIKILSLSLTVGVVSSLAYWSAFQALLIILLMIRM